jgi:hypothetical protein
MRYFVFYIINIYVTYIRKIRYTLWTVVKHHNPYPIYFGFGWKIVNSILANFINVCIKLFPEGYKPIINGSSRKLLNRSVSSQALHMLRSLSYEDEDCQHSLNRQAYRFVLTFSGQLLLCPCKLTSQLRLLFFSIAFLQVSAFFLRLVPLLNM